MVSLSGMFIRRVLHDKEQAPGASGASKDNLIPMRPATVRVLSAVAGTAMGIIMGNNLGHITDSLSSSLGSHHTAEASGVPDPIPWPYTSEPRQQYIDPAIGGLLKRAVCSTVQAPQYTDRLFPGAATVTCQTNPMGLEVHDSGQVARGRATISLTPMTAENFRLKSLEPGTKCNFRTMLCTGVPEEGPIRAESFSDGHVATVVYEGHRKADTHLVHALAMLATNLVKLPGTQA